ncbi:MAG: hypothetical protein IKQ94_10835 [Bacteroidales bacterium]|nr:hypothetical protein [Bacteroidales bacterium]
MTKKIKFYRVLKSYNRKPDRIHVLRVQIPIEECPKPCKSCNCRNNGVCLRDGNCDK